MRGRETTLFTTIKRVENRGGSGIWDFWVRVATDLRGCSRDGGNRGIVWGPRHMVSNASQFSEEN